MWDWELLKSNAGCHSYRIIADYKNEDFQYTLAESQVSPEDEYCLHNHALYEIVCGLGGEAVYMVEGVRYTLEPGGLLIINPTVSHKLFVSPELPFKRHTLFIHYASGPSSLGSLISHSQRSNGDKRIGSMYYPPEDAVRCAQSFARMSEICQAQDEHVRALAPCFAQSMLAELAALMYQKHPQRCSQGVSHAMDSLIEYLSQNFTKNLSLQSIANTFHLSKDYCNRLFHDATGMTVMQYILYNRILLARQLLMNGASAADVARQVGYSDYSSFYRAYHKVTGRSPSDDREIPEQPQAGRQA